ncbi:MULE domain-containing protein [Aphis craccivora]|uniref:MULE domain-containing protein n=1 Tax=Aphis craccivora TaxID=307492 RepID=A0A6G0WQR7_APHCR|nr:MULE domain-containing protein [Aphis craccivora]
MPILITDDLMIKLYWVRELFIIRLMMTALNENLGFGFLSINHILSLRILFFSIPPYYNGCIIILLLVCPWFVDGNFGLAPNFFTQLYVIRIQKNRTKNAINLWIYISSYYGRLSKNAAKLIFGNDINIRGCFYHLCQSTYRKVQEIGLSNRYKEYEGFRLFCAMIDSLAFLPLNKVKEVMEYLKRNIPNEADDLLIYFETYYVNGAYKRVGNAAGVNVSVRLRRLQPMFPPNTWNVHDTTLHGSHRTNKSTEGWNNRFAHLVVTADLGKLALNDVGESFNKRKKQKKNKELCTRIQNDEINIEGFLKAIAYNIRKRSYSMYDIKPRAYFFILSA